jgi:ribosome-binding protein aMBF1 (putative translation factor)
MATDIKKFLDQAGVSTLWSRVAEEVAKVDAKAVKNAEDIAAHAGKIQTMEGQIAALEAGTYDDSEVRSLIADNKAAHEANATAIGVLNGNAETAGSVANTATTIAAAEVAKIVANADADFDTLKEIADWILNDTTGAADMANDIKALQDQMVGVDTTVVAEIASAIEEALKAEGVEKYALATELSALASRVETLEKAGYQNAEQVGAAIDAKIEALKLDETYDALGSADTAEQNAKDYADSLAVNYDAAGSAATAEQNAKAYADSLAVNYDEAGAAAQALVDAKAYTDAEMAKIQALSTEDIDAAIAAAKAQAQA